MDTTVNRSCRDRRFGESLFINSFHIHRPFYKPQLKRDQILIRLKSLVFLHLSVPHHPPPSPFCLPAVKPKINSQQKTNIFIFLAYWLKLYSIYTNSLYPGFQTGVLVFAYRTIVGDLFLKCFSIQRRYLFFLFWMWLPTGNELPYWGPLLRCC